MMKRLLSTNDDGAFLVLRLALGVMIFPHGAQKLLGWFGGYGFSGTMDFLTGTMGIPYLFALLAILAEFFGGLGLLLGIGTRFSALAVGGTMLVASMFHFQNGFFMNWSGSQAGEGFEFHLMAVAMAVALVWRGGGMWSADRKLGLQPG